MDQATTSIGEGGEVVLPAAFCQALDWRPGDEIVVRLEKHSMRILNFQGAVRNAQTIVRQHVPEGRSLVDELIAERRAEAANE